MSTGERGTVEAGYDIAVYGDYLRPVIAVSGIILDGDSVIRRRCRAVNCEHDVHHGDIYGAVFGARVVAAGGERVADGCVIVSIKICKRFFDGILVHLGAIIGISGCAGDFLVVYTR